LPSSTAASIEKVATLLLIALLLAPAPRNLASGLRASSPNRSSIM
jgi:hypothetical protein